MEVIANAPTELDIVRAWKDARYRRSLSDEQLQTLPAHPAGPAMFTDQEFKIAGGIPAKDDFIIPGTTAPECTLLTFHHWKSCGCEARAI